MLLDLPATLDALAGAADELAHLATRALDMRLPFTERQAAAMGACELLDRSGLLARLRLAKGFLAANRPHLEKALQVGRFLQNFR